MESSWRGRIVPRRRVQPAGASGLLAAAAERWIASLISRIERSISASSSSSGDVGAEHAGLDGRGEHLLAERCRSRCRWSLSLSSARFPLDREHRDVVALRAAVAQRLLDQLGHRVGDRAVGDSCSMISLSLDACPTGRRSTAARGRRRCSSSGPAVSTTGLPGLPRQVNSTLRLKRSPIGTTWLIVSLQLGVRVVARAGDQLVAAHQVQARIAAVRPVGGVALQHAGDDGGARRVDQRLLRSRSAAAGGGRRRSRRAGSAAGPSASAWRRAGTSRRASAARAARRPRLRGGRPCRRRARTGPTSRV